MLESIRTLIEVGKFQEAQARCLQASTALQENALYHLYCGVIAARLGNLSDAERAFERSLEKDVTLVAAHLNLAQIYKATKDPRGVEFLIKASYLNPKDPTLFDDIQKIAPQILNYPKADVVFYTGTPFLKMKFSPDSLKEGALGGSETAFVRMALELSRLGLKVVCFCNTPERKNYEGVDYIPVGQFFLYNRVHEISTFVASRFLYPFEHSVRAKRKILWLHEARGCADQSDISPYVDTIDFFLGLSDYQISLISERYPIPSEKWIKTRNGFISDLFSEDLPSQKSQSLVYVSRPERGLKEAIEVFERLQSQFSKLTLQVCGYTQENRLEDDPAFAPFVSKLKMEGVQFHGSLSKPQLADLLKKSSLMIYPNVSDAETSCIAAIEAMAAGTPVITSDLGALPETVVDGVGGKVVPYNGGGENFILALQKKIEGLFSQPLALEQLSKSAHHRAWTQYTWKQVAREWVELFVVVEKNVLT